MCSDESQDMSLFKANAEEATKGGWRTKANLPLLWRRSKVRRHIRAIFARSAAGQPLFNHNFLALTPAARLSSACLPGGRLSPCVASLSAARLLPTCPLPATRLPPVVQAAPDRHALLKQCSLRSITVCVCQPACRRCPPPAGTRPPPDCLPGRPPALHPPPGRQRRPLKLV